MKATMNTVKAEDILWFPAVMSNKAARVDFDNGYSASIVVGPLLPSFSGSGLYEVAIFDIAAEEIVYDTPITDDVAHANSDRELEALLKRIRALPRRKEAA